MSVDYLVIFSIRNRQDFGCRDDQLHLHIQQIRGIFLRALAVFPEEGSPPPSSTADVFLSAFSTTTDALPVCIRSVVKPAGPEKSRLIALSYPAASTRRRPASPLILPPATIIAPESCPNVDAPHRNPRCGQLNVDARGALRPSSILNA
jgi:hypothetical protein